MKRVEEVVTIGSVAMVQGDIADAGWRLFCAVTGLYLAGLGTYAVVTRRMPRGVAGVRGNPPPLVGRPAVVSGIAFLGAAGLFLWWAMR
jgi:hypothetical protein